MGMKTSSQLDATGGASDNPHLLFFNIYAYSAFLPLWHLFAWKYFVATPRKVRTVLGKSYLWITIIHGSAFGCYVYGATTSTRCGCIKVEYAKMAVRFRRDEPYNTQNASGCC